MIDHVIAPGLVDSPEEYAELFGKSSDCVFVSGKAQEAATEVTHVAVQHARGIPFGIYRHQKELQSNLKLRLVAQQPPYLLKDYQGCGA